MRWLFEIDQCGLLLKKRCAFQSRCNRFPCQTTSNFQTTNRRLQFLYFCCCCCCLQTFQLFCSMSIVKPLLLSVIYQRVILKSCDVSFQLPHLPEAALQITTSVSSSPSQNQLSISIVLYGTSRIVIKCNFRLPCQFFSSS